MCQETPVFQYTDFERTWIAVIALERQKDAVLWRTGKFLETEAQALDRNPLGNHFTGVATEAAVSRWLESEDIRHEVPASLWIELTQGAPDISTNPHGVKLDVKGSVSYGHCRFRHDQLKDDKDIAVVWCHPRYVGTYDQRNDYNTEVPNSVKILGWSTMDEVNKGKLEGDCHELPIWEIRPLLALLEWLKAGERSP